MKGRYARPLILAALFLATGCGDEGGPTQSNKGTDDTISLAADVQPIFTARCAVADCHDSATDAGGLSLETGMSHAELVGVESPTYDDPALRVDPGNPAGSLLLLKLEGADGVGSRMPLGGGALADDEIALVETWIADGAEDN